MRANETRINDGIRAAEVRVIDEDGTQLGVMTPHEAVRVAEAKGLDVVEVSPTANPPVCRIMDYGKYKFMEAKREHAARAKQKNIVVKEVKFRPRTDDHDFDFKVKHILRFLEEGDKVKVVVMFRGREVVHRDIGYRIIEDVLTRIGERCIVEKPAGIDGRDMHAIIIPRPVEQLIKKVKPTKPPTPAADEPGSTPEGAKVAGSL
ncbi:translation initiation factor IF-3 [Geothrix sp. 21YS21S-2]|uniref:translation initiation factor IF-3 n=1 Tax=Geothrix sp. 21YS21S-2 TaxID=3068893 RepID=UPI0027B9EF2E|nr:translation initiation factor IF-3 [Geothrix sp. 21YS21S-2]